MTAPRNGASRPLNAKQQRFVDEYLVDLNATQAAIRAGYSKKTAGAIGGELLEKPEIASAVAVGQAKRENRTHITQDKVLRELAILAFSDVRHFQYDEDSGKLLLSENAPDEAWRAVSSVKYRTVTSKNGDRIHEAELKLWDKNSALQMAGKHLGMFLDRVANPDGSALSGSVVVVPGSAKDMAEWLKLNKPEN